MKHGDIDPKPFRNDDGTTNESIGGNWGQSMPNSDRIQKPISVIKKDRQLASRSHTV